MRNPLQDKLAGLGLEHDRIEGFLERWRAVQPHGVACIDSDHSISWSELGDLVDRAARRLHQAGVRAGDCVALLAPPSADFLVSFLASMRVDATWLGLNPKYTRRELEEVLRDAQPRLVLARRRIADRDYTADLEAVQQDIAVAGGRLIWLERNAAGSVSRDLLETGDLSALPFSATDIPSNPIAALVYTSGTTGKPKAARLTHRGLIRAALVRSTVWDVAPLRLVHNVPINHVGGLGDLNCTAIVAGGTQVFLERFSAATTLQAIARHGVTYWYQAPTMFELCLSAPEAADVDWSSLQAAIWSGGHPSDALVAQLAAVAPRIGVDYSMTESIGPITLTPLWANGGYDGGVGWPDPGRQLGIVAADGTVCAAAGQIGEVVVRDEWMFDGYREGQNTVESRDGWFRTGDLATFDERGVWRLVGRSKEMFKSGGYNVYPREVEFVLETIPGVLSAAVVAVPDALYGEVGVAFVAVTDTIRPYTLGALCRDLLANYKVPKRFEIVEALPMLPIGKVDKQTLRARARELMQ